MNSQPRSLDFITRLANAWDGRGSTALTLAECRALWDLAYLEPFDAQPMWCELNPQQRSRLVMAARAAVQLGRAMQDVFAG